MEKVYTVGSYYWSQKNTSPEELFGGKWESISGRFLFSTDSNHSVDSTGGEEMHSLTKNEMPSHNHGYDRFTWNGCCCPPTSGSNYKFPYIYYKMNSFFISYIFNIEKLKNKFKINIYLSIPPPTICSYIRRHIIMRLISTCITCISI